MPLNETLMIDEQSPCRAHEGMLDDFINPGSAKTPLFDEHSNNDVLYASKSSGK